MAREVAADGSLNPPLGREKPPETEEEEVEEEKAAEEVGAG